MFWVGSEVATLSTDAKSSSFDAVSRRAVCGGWERLFSFWSISVPFVGVITNRYNSKLTRPMLAGSSVPMPDELMELYNLYQQELHTRRAKDRIVEMKHIRKYCAQYLILKKSFVLLLPILLQTLPLFEEILLPGKMRKRQTSYQSWTRC